MPTNPDRGPVVLGWKCESCGYFCKLKPKETRHWLIGCLCPSESFTPLIDRREWKKVRAVMVMQGETNRLLGEQNTALRGELEAQKRIAARDWRNVKRLTGERTTLKATHDKLRADTAKFLDDMSMEIHGQYLSPLGVAQELQKRAALLRDGEQGGG